MPRTRTRIAYDAHAAARIVEAATTPLRFDDIRSRLRAAGIQLSVKQARRTIELAEQLGLVARVNRARWGRAGATAAVPSARRSRTSAVVDAALRLLELPASPELSKAVRSVLRLAASHEAQSVLARPVPAKPPSSAAPAAPDNGATRAGGTNGAHDATDPIEILFHPHS